MSTEDSNDLTPATGRAGNLMVWLGGGGWRDIDESGERSRYQTAGCFVLLSGLVAWTVAAAAAVSAGGLGPVAGVAVTAPLAVFCGALGRVLATAPGRRGTLVGLGLAGTLVGVLLGELAALVVFQAPLTQQLNLGADRAAASVASGERAAALAGLRADRAGLDDRVAQAGTRRDAALLVARCEQRPAPGCPPQLITGQPGLGAEATQARTALAGADVDLTTARAERDRRAPELDRAIASTTEQVARDRDTAEQLARQDTGLVARWGAMNGYTGEHPAAWFPRLAAVLLLVLITLAPLLLRLWRGPTDHDLVLAARRAQRRAELDADTAIAVRRAEVRAELELRRQEELLNGGPAAVAAAAEIEREREPELPARPAPAALTAGPEPVTDLAVPERSDLLDRLPGPLPEIARAIADVAGEYVPGPIARLATDPPRPVRAVRRLMEEAEEFEFTLKHKRKVTVTEEHYEDAAAEPAADPEPRPIVFAEVIEGELAIEPPEDAVDDEQPILVRDRREERRALRSGRRELRSGRRSR